MKNEVQKISLSELMSQISSKEKGMLADELSSALGVTKNNVVTNWFNRSRGYPFPMRLKDESYKIIKNFISSRGN